MTWTKTDDDIENLVNLLINEWTVSTVARPEIRHITEQGATRRIEDRNTDWVLIYEVGHREEVAGCGSNAGYRIDDRFSIDIRTKDSRLRLIALYKEIKRILAANRVHPTDSEGTRLGWSISAPLTERKDLCDKRSGLFRYVYDVELFKTYEALVT